MDKCIFCLVSDSEISRCIYKDRVCSVILSRYPVEKGHLIVVSKFHYSDMLSTPDPVISHMFKVSRKFGKRAKTKLKCSGIVIGANVGAVVSIHHFHIHILPIYNKKNLHFAFAQGKNEMQDKEITEIKSLLTF